MSSSSKTDEVPVEFKRSDSENADSNENIEKQIKGPTKVTEQNGNNKHVKKEKECRRPSKKRWLVKLSVANLTMGLMNIAFGIAVFIESKELSHWLTSCAFSIWYGCLVSIRFLLFGYSHLGWLIFYSTLYILYDFVTRLRNFSAQLFKETFFNDVMHLFLRVLLS